MKNDDDDDNTNRLRPIFFLFFCNFSPFFQTIFAIFPTLPQFTNLFHLSFGMFIILIQKFLCLIYNSFQFFHHFSNSFTGVANGKGVFLRLCIVQVRTNELTLNWYLHSSILLGSRSITNWDSSKKDMFSIVVSQLSFRAIFLLIKVG